MSTSGNTGDGSFSSSVHCAFWGKEKKGKKKNHLDPSQAYYPVCFFHPEKQGGGEHALLLFCTHFF